MDFTYKIGQELKDDKRDITITEQRNIGKRYYKYKCNQCGFDCGEHYKDGEYKEELLISEFDIKRGQGCSCCNGHNIVVENINSICKTDPWLISYFQGGYDEAKKYKAKSNQSIIPKCPECGRIKSKKIPINVIHRYHSISCICNKGKSYPNKLAYNMLEQLKLKFIDEYSPNWIKPRAYDFYFELNDKKYIIEMDGGFHEKDNTMSGQTKEESKAIDNYKDEQARLHNIEVIRIDCNYKNNDRFKYIKQNIINNRYMSKLFNLNNINWDKCNEYGCLSLIKIACEYKNNNPDLTTTQIGEIMNLDKSTIRNYLIIGNGIWCNYDGKEEMRKNNKIQAKKQSKINSKMLINLNDGKIFNSIHDCERLSLQFYKIFLDFRNISAVCRGVRNHTGGQKFKYIEDLTTKEYIKYDIENKLKELHNQELIQAC